MTTKKRIKPKMFKCWKWYYEMFFKNYLFEIIDSWHFDDNRWYLQVFTINDKKEKDAYKYCLCHPTKKECLIQLEMMLNNEYLID